MKVLIVEDDKHLRNILCESIAPHFQYSSTGDGEEGLYLAEQDIYDAIILDIMLPGMDGYTVLENLRRKGIQTPVLFLTAKDSIEDKLKGFRVGADDYIVKPFHRDELLARLEAVVRRSGGLASNNIIKFKELMLNLSNKTVSISEHDVLLQGKQFDFLEYLLNHIDTILTKEQIFDRIWGFDSYTTVNVVEVYASNLRKKLKEFDYDKYMKTVRGLGYMWVSGEDKHV